MQLKIILMIYFVFYALVISFYKLLIHLNGLLHKIVKLLRREAPQ